MTEIDFNTLFTTVKIDESNANNFQDLLNSIKYITKYSGYDPETMSAINSITNPDLPKNGIPENNHIKGVIEKKTNEPVAWIQYYEGFIESDIIFLGEFFIHKAFQNQGIGKLVLNNFESIWIKKGMHKAILNVDLKNWQGINFWTSNGYSKIEKVFGDKEYSDSTFAMLRLSKSLRND